MKERIKVMVKPNVVKDDDMLLLAHNVVKQIEENLSYPGQIKVNIIRESRLREKFLILFNFIFV